MIVSYLDGEYLYGIDLSEKGAEVFFVSEDDAQKILHEEYKITSHLEGEVVLEEPSVIEVIEGISMLKGELIAKKYSITDQLNLMRKVLCGLSEDRELHTMDEFIGNILVSNGEDEGDLQ